MYRCLRHPFILLLLVPALGTTVPTMLLAQPYPGGPYGPMPPYLMAPGYPGMAPQIGPTMPLMPPAAYPAPAPLAPGAPAQFVHQTAPVAPEPPVAPVPEGEPHVHAGPGYLEPGPGHPDEDPGPVEEEDLIGKNQVLAAVPMLGRGDSLNRFNLFDNMSALPQNRIWYGYQSLSDFQTGFGDYRSPALPLSMYRIVQLQRMGCEWALGSLCSFACQWQYVASTGTNASNDAWANPQCMFKWAAYDRECVVISPVLGVQIQTPQAHGELHENTSRIQPGVLFFSALEDWLILQGGLQVSVPFSRGASTVDFGLSLGWWLHRDSSLDFAGRRTQSWERTALPFVTGIIPTLELWGKHVLSGANQMPLDPYIPGQVYRYSGYEEVRHVYDLTAGVRFLLYNHFSLGLAYSFPLTGKYVRSDEFICSLNINF